MLELLFWGCDQVFIGIQSSIKSKGQPLENGEKDMMKMHERWDVSNWAHNDNGAIYLLLLKENVAQPKTLNSSPTIWWVKWQIQM